MIKEVLGLLKKKNLFINKDKKKNILKNYFNNLTSFHYKNCYEYKKICNQLGYYIKKKYEISELPFLPVNIFKLINLRSVKKKKYYYHNEVLRNNKFESVPDSFR